MAQKIKTDPTDIYVDSLKTALDRSDKCAIYSVGILAIGMIAVASPSGPAGITLPGGLRIASTNAAFIVILAAHLLNGFRYCFYLKRAAEIATTLPSEIRKALSSHPSPATSNVMTESVQSLLLSVLTFPIVKEVFEVPALIQFGLAAALTSPFVVGAVKMRKHLNFALPKA